MSDFFMKILFYFERLDNVRVALVCMVTIILLGYLDMISGFEYSFSFFYLIPVSIAAWGIGRQAGLAISIICAIVWMLSNFLAGEVYSSQFVAVWNTLIRLGFFTVVTVLLSSLKIALSRERDDADTDELTGLSNKRSFLEQVQLQIELKDLTGRACTLVYIDLDSFKQVNDTYGHHIGDLLLSTVAKVMQNAIRGKDLAGRLGGDEFALMLIETKPENVEMIINRLYSNLIYAMQKNNWSVTFSIGAVTFKEQMPTAKEMISLVDQVMYQVKHSGKNRYLIEEYPNLKTEN